MEPLHAHEPRQDAHRRPRDPDGRGALRGRFPRALVAVVAAVSLAVTGCIPLPLGDRTPPRPTSGTDSAQAGDSSGTDGSGQTGASATPDPIADAQVGDCFHDYGGETEADLEPAPACADGTFEVVDVVTGTTDLSMCDSVDQVSTSVSSSANNLVLCLSYNYGLGDAYHAQPGECVFGAPDPSTPWNAIECQTGAFEVLERLQGESDRNQCTDSTYYNHSIAFTTSEDYLDVVLCMSMIYPSDIGYAEMDNCMQMTGTAPNADYTFSDCGSANIVVTGRTNEYDAQGFCGNHGWQTWQSSDFPEHSYTVCWRYL